MNILGKIFIYFRVVLGVFFMSKFMSETRGHQGYTAHRAAHEAEAAAGDWPNASATALVKPDHETVP